MINVDNNQVTMNGNLGQVIIEIGSVIQAIIMRSPSELQCGIKEEIESQLAWAMVIGEIGYEEASKLSDFERDIKIDEHMKRGSFE
ncbi:MAG TPA: hypothetical protein DDW34_12900 [Clostridium sp.]|nr:hypothetical protein [Clostridium sp.]